MSDSEYHVSSFVVRSQPEDGTDVAASIDSIDGLEVHVEEDGKLIVTAEAANVRELADLSDVLQQTEKVISVSPVYHEFSNDKEPGASVSLNNDPSTRVKIR